MKHILFTFFSAILLTACQSETQDSTNNELIGDWIFESAAIDGNTDDGNALLSSTSFSFTTDKVSCNLFEQLGIHSTQADYKIKEEQIIVEDNKIRFNIKTLEANKLSLSFEAMPDGTTSRQFEINLKKQ